MVKDVFGNLKKVWRCRRNFGGAGRKTQLLFYTVKFKCIPNPS